MTAQDDLSRTNPSPSFVPKLPSSAPCLFLMAMWPLHFMGSHLQGNIPPFRSLMKSFRDFLHKTCQQKISVNVVNAARVLFAKVQFGVPWNLRSRIWPALDDAMAGMAASLCGGRSTLFCGRVAWFRSIMPMGV